MKHLMTLLALVVAVTAGAQEISVDYPYNPDYENDGNIGVEDLMQLLSSFGTEFDIEEIIVENMSLTSWAADVSSTLAYHEFLLENLTGELEIEYWELPYGYFAYANLSQTFTPGAFGSDPLLDLTGVNFNGSNLTGAWLPNSTLTNAYVSNANLSYANLEHADLSYADLSNAYLYSANLIYAYLPNANLSDANLTGTYLEGANLEYADLSNAYLYNTDLSWANLAYADITNAILSGTTLTGAYLYYADFTNANFANVNWTGAYIEGCTGCPCEDVNNDNICD